jgi:hypothetical protein
MAVKEEMGRTRKKAVVLCFKIPPSHFLGLTEEAHKHLSKDSLSTGGIRKQVSQKTKLP